MYLRPQYMSTVRKETHTHTKNGAEKSARPNVPYQTSQNQRFHKIRGCKTCSRV